MPDDEHAPFGIGGDRPAAIEFVRAADQVTLRGEAPAIVIESGVKQGRTAVDWLGSGGLRAVPNDMRLAVASGRQLRPANRPDGYGAACLTVHLQRIGPTTICGAPPVEDVRRFGVTGKVDQMDCPIGCGDGLGLKARFRQSLDAHRRSGLCDDKREGGRKSQQQCAGVGR